jgi:hypothetical protein
MLQWHRFCCSLQISQSATPRALQNIVSGRAILMRRGPWNKKRNFHHNPTRQRGIAHFG